MSNDDSSSLGSLALALCNHALAAGGTSFVPTDPALAAQIAAAKLPLPDSVRLDWLVELLSGDLGRICGIIFRIPQIPGGDIYHIRPYPEWITGVDVTRDIYWAASVMAILAGVWFSPKVIREHYDPNRIIAAAQRQLNGEAFHTLIPLVRAA